MELTYSHTTKFWIRPNSKHLLTKKLNVTKMIISNFDGVENIVGKGEIACTSNFSFSYNVFKSLLSQTRQKVSLSGKRLRRFENNCSEIVSQPFPRRNNVLGLSKIIGRRQTKCACNGGTCFGVRRKH